MNDNNHFTQLANLDTDKVSRLSHEIDLSDSQSILDFGVKAQKELTAAADQMLQDVRSKDIGQTGSLLNDMFSLIKGFRQNEQTLHQKPGWFRKLLGKPHQALSSFLGQYDSISDKIDRISNELEEQKQTLLIDIKSLDTLYQTNLDYYHELCHYLAAGEQVLQHCDNVTLPALREQAESAHDITLAQALRDQQTRRDELERRVHDLRLTRQVAMQTLPSIRLLQENDKGLVNKINSTLVNTVPLWRQQLAQAIAIHHAQHAGDMLKASTDLTNQLLEQNADNLKQANRQAREQVERGVFDIQSIEHANQSLIDTIEESIHLHKQAKEQRQQAISSLNNAEQALKQALLSASRQQEKP